MIRPSDHASASGPGSSAGDQPSVGIEAGGSSATDGASLPRARVPGAAGVDVGGAGEGPGQSRPCRGSGASTHAWVKPIGSRRTASESEHALQLIDVGGRRQTPDQARLEKVRGTSRSGTGSPGNVALMDGRFRVGRHGKSRPSCESAQTTCHACDGRDRADCPAAAVRNGRHAGFRLDSASDPAPNVAGSPGQIRQRAGKPPHRAAREGAISGDAVRAHPVAGRLALRPRPWASPLKRNRSCHAARSCSSCTPISRGCSITVAGRTGWTGSTRPPAETYLPLWRVLNDARRTRLAGRHDRPLPRCCASSSRIPTSPASSSSYLEQKIAAAVEDRAYFQRTGETPPRRAGRALGAFLSRHARGLHGPHGVNRGGALPAARRARRDRDHHLWRHARLFPAAVERCARSRSQVRTACTAHRRHFGRAPRGIWLPECAYRPAGPWRSPVDRAGAAGAAEAASRRSSRRRARRTSSSTATC